MQKYEEYILRALTLDSRGRVKSRERNDLDYKQSFGQASWVKYAKTMASFANNVGGYIIFGVKDNPREIVGVNKAFDSFDQEKFTDLLNSLFAPEIVWDCGLVEVDGKNVGYIYTYPSMEKPVIALRQETSEKISSGDVYYRYRARSEKIKYSEMKRLLDDRERRESERIYKLIETIKNSETTNLGIVNYTNGHFSTPYGVDVTIDKRLVVQILRKAKYIKSGCLSEDAGAPVLKITGNIDLTEAVPVPNIEPDIQYPYLQKNLKEKLGLVKNETAALIWYFRIKEDKRYHLEVSLSGSNKLHKYSDIALQFLADKLNEHKLVPEWLQDIVNQYNESNRKK